MANVCLQALTKSYTRGLNVIDGIDLTVQDGELFFLLGPSGCGKSTLLRLIAGFLQPDSGAIRFGSKEVTQIPPERRDTAMVFQNYALWPHMTVAENVAFGLEVRKVPKAEQKQQIADALELVDMGAYADRSVTALSGGQQQRVALARALVVKPGLLLLDEPLSNLDAKLRNDMRCEIRRICKELKLTAIYVTHDQKEALSMADRMAVLQQGKIAQVGSPREVYGQPASRFVADFIGACNFLPGTVIARTPELITLETPWGKLATSRVESFDLKPKDTCTVGIRPEAMQTAFTATDNTLALEIREIQYLGECSQLLVAAGEIEGQVLEYRPRPHDVGARIPVYVDPDDVMLLPAESS